MNGTTGPKGVNVGGVVHTKYGKPRVDTFTWLRHMQPGTTLRLIDDNNRPATVTGINEKGHTVTVEFYQGGGRRTRTVGFNDINWAEGAFSSGLNITHG